MRVLRNPLVALSLLAIFAVLPPAAAERTIEDLSDQIYEATISIHKEIVASNASIHKEIAASNASIREEITTSNASIREEITAINTSIVVLETKYSITTAILSAIGSLLVLGVTLLGVSIRKRLHEHTDAVARHTGMLEVLLAPQQASAATARTARR